MRRNAARRLGRWVCAVALSAPAGLAAAPAGPLAADVLQRLSVRDGLVAPGDPDLHRLGARNVTGQWRAELDGSPPREIIVEVVEYTGEGTWQTEYRAYRDGPSLPTPLAAPIISGGYRDPGYPALRDLDGDGRDALIVVGDTDGGSPSTLDVWRVHDGRWVQRVWGPDVGLDYVVPAGPLDRAAIAPDPGSPIVALRPAEDGFIAEPWVFVDGLYRPWPVDDRPLLGPLLAELAEHRPRRPDHVYPRLAVALNRAGVQPPEGTLRRLRGQHRALEQSWHHAALLRAMAWPGNVAAAPHFRRFLDPPTASDLAAAAAEGLIAVGTELDRVKLLDGLLRDDSRRSVAQAVVRGFAARSDPRARARLAAALHEPARPTSDRAEIVELLGLDPAALPDLARALDAAGAPREAIAHALWRRALSTPEHPAWHLPVVADAARRLLGDASARISRDAVLVVRVGDPRAEETLRAAATRVDPRHQGPILTALAEMDPDLSLQRQVAAAAADALRGAAFDNLTVARHRLVARWGDDAARAAGLNALLPDHVDTPRLLDNYARGLAARAPRDPAAVDRMSAQLMLLIGAERGDRVRQSAARALGPLDHDRARTALTVALQGDPVFYVRSDAADALGRRHPEVEAALIVRLMREPEAHVRGAIITALGRHGTPRARATLIDRLRHPRDGWAAAHALARVPDAAGLEVGEVLARYAQELLDGAEGCQTVKHPLGALARAGLPQAAAVLERAQAVCGDEAAALVASAIDGWQRDGSAASRRRVLGFAGADERSVARAAWHALQNWP